MVLAQEDEVHITLVTSSHSISSDSVSILLLEDETINQEIEILFYPNFDVLKTMIIECDSAKRINSMVLLASIKEGGVVKIHDIAFLGNGNNEIKDSLLKKISSTIVTKGYKLLNDSVPISIKLRIRDMNYK